MKHNLVVCGGTFDHFHKGHEELLKLAFSIGQKVVVGVTSEDYVEKSKINPSALLRARIQESKIEPFEKRKQAILNFLRVNKHEAKSEVIKIDDVFGPTLDKNLNIDAIVVTKETFRNANVINRKRQKAGLPKLAIIVAPLSLGQNNKPISSGQIRKGLIDRQGNLYLNPLWFGKDLFLTEELRRELRKPFGSLTLNVQKHLNNSEEIIITVGDVTTKNFNTMKINQNISVVDLKVARKKKFDTLYELGFLGNEKVLKAENPPGYITSDLLLQIAGLFDFTDKSRVILQIDGEEDLAVLPLVLAAPLYTIIYYGQPKEGLVEVLVTESVKRKAYNFVDKFTTLGH